MIIGKENIKSNLILSLSLIERKRLILTINSTAAVLIIKIFKLPPQRYNTFNIKIGSSLHSIAGDSVFSHVFVHGLLDGQLMDSHLLTLILKNFNLVLLALKDLLSLPSPLGLLICLAEGGSKDHFFILKLFNGLVLEWHNPFIRLLK